MSQADELIEALARCGMIKAGPPLPPSPAPTPTYSRSRPSPRSTSLNNSDRDATRSNTPPSSSPAQTALSIYDYWHPDHDYGTAADRNNIPTPATSAGSDMAENIPPATGGSNANGAGVPAGATAGIPYYEKQRQELKVLIAKKKILEKKLASTEEMIYSKETDYLESTPSGNIIIGFDNYTKGTTGAAAQRRKTGLTDANRVFSRSSISYNPNAEPPTPAASTPASHAPTPSSSSFANKDKAESAAASAAPTPTSTTASKAGKKGKKASAARPDDSETDARETKKARTNFGAVRK